MSRKAKLKAYRVITNKEKIDMSRRAKLKAYRVGSILIFLVCFLPQLLNSYWGFYLPIIFNFEFNWLIVIFIISSIVYLLSDPKGS